MKFQLFGRLKDDDNSGGGNQGQEQGGFPGMDEPPATNDMRTGNSLERTVENMFNQGYSEEEINQELSGQYSTQDINDAINRAVANNASSRNSSEGPEPMSTYNGGKDAMSPIDEDFDKGAGGNEDMGNPGDIPEGPPAPESQGAQNGPSGNQNVDTGTEELVETIVAENMDQILQEFNQVYGELDEMKEQMQDLEDRVHDLEVRDDEDQQQFIQKVDEMEDHVDDYQSRIGGLEKAFQQILPSLVDNVRDLTELVQEIKQERGIETETSMPDDEISDIDVEDW